MDINKNVVIKYIYRGVYYNLKIVFKGYYNNVIPVYISKDVSDIVALQLKDSSVIVIINDELENRYTNDFIEQLVVFNVLKIYYKELKTNHLVDACCAYWYGFKSTIEMIKLLNRLSDEQKIERINFIEKLMISDKELTVPLKDDIINSIKYVRVMNNGEDYEKIS